MNTVILMCGAESKGSTVKLSAKAISKARLTSWAALIAAEMRHTDRNTRRVGAGYSSIHLPCRSAACLPIVR